MAAITSTTDLTSMNAGPTYTTVATGAKLADIKLSKVIWVEHEIESFFSSNGFIGKNQSPNAIIWLQEDLSKGGGETIRFFMNKRLTGSGVTGDSVLLGNEEQLNYDYFEVTLDQLRNAVSIGGALAEQRSIANMRVDAKNRLRTWMAEKLDAKLFTALSAGTPTYTVYAGDATSVGTLSSTSTMDLSVIGKARSIARLNRIKGVTINGKQTFAFIMHIEQAYDLQNNTDDSKWQDIQAAANVRGEKNPIFNGALGMYLGVVLYEHENVSQADTGGSGGDLHYSMALFLGAGAAVRAYGGFKDTGKQVKAVEDAFDYKNVYACALAVIVTEGKTKFSSDLGSTYTDWALVAVYTACTDLS